MQGKNLSAEQILLMTLVVKLAVMAALATMLVRYRRFRHILIFERRAWPDRLIFALSLGIPLTAGVVSRLLLHYDAADLTLEGSFLAGLIAGDRRGAGDGAGRRDADQDLEQRADRTSTAGAGEAAVGGENRGAGESDQPAFSVQHADVDLVVDSHAAGDGTHAHLETVGPLAPPAARNRSFRDAAGGARVDRRVSRHRGRPLRSPAQGDQAHQP